MNERLAEFRVVDKPQGLRLALLEKQGGRQVTTMEGRLAGSWLAQTHPVAWAYAALIALAEVSTLLVGGRAGIVLHGVTLLLLVTHASLVRRLNPLLARFLVAMGPVPLIRITSLTSPLAEFTYIQWFSIVAVILYAGIVTAIKLLKPDVTTIGLRLPARRHLPLEAAVALSGFALGYVEYLILRPGALLHGLTFRDLAAPVLVLYVSTGLLEELLFRGILMKYASDAMGRPLGIVYVVILFAVLHTGWNSWLDVIFVGLVGLFFSLVVVRTKSLVGVSIAHGITNSMLFLVMPLLAH